MCDCENMTASLREKKIAEFFESVIKRHADENGKVDFDKLDTILISLGRRVSGERIVKLRKKFDTENTGKINHNDPDLILAIASINVVDVSAIDDDVLNTAFKTFDLDEDGKISLHEMRIVLSLFLPVNIQQEQENVESTIYSMDSRRDGEIRLQDFVKGVREVGSFKLARYKEEMMLASLMLAGFILYQVLSEFGMLPVIGFHEGPLA